MVRTIKLLQMLLFLCGVCISHSVWAGDMQAPSCPGSSVTRGPGDDTHPWPWGFEVQFPWDHIQGIWKVEKGSRTYYFSFKRILTKRILIHQFDVATCKVVGTGQGYERDRTVRSQIRNNMTNEVYNLTLAAFNEDGLPANENDVATPYYVMVARINSVNRIQPQFEVKMTRISDRLEFKCGEQDKKVRF